MRTSSWLRAALPPLCVFVLLLAGQPGTGAQERPQERVLFVSALDDQGRPVTGLGPDAFDVREDGVRREVLRVIPADDEPPIDLTLMVDNSQASRELTSIYRTALPAFVEAMTPEHRVSLVGLADRPTILVPSTSETTRLTDRIGGLFPTPESGMTLLDAMIEVADGLRRRGPPRAAIVAVFSDGPEFTNRYAKDVVNSLQQAYASVHLVTIGTFQEDLEHAARERTFFIAQAPRATGGAHHALLSPHALGDYLDQVSRDLLSQYKVIYATSQALIPPRSIAVSAAKPGLTMRGTPERPGKGA
jgi:Mg-chelatase subunit ChlD